MVFAIIGFDFCQKPGQLTVSSFGFNYAYSGQQYLVILILEIAEKHLQTFAGRLTSNPLFVLVGVWTVPAQDNRRHGV